MKFFTPEDFEPCSQTLTAAGMADRANTKIEKEGRVVYGDESYQTNLSNWDCQSDETTTHKALLICVEPIEKCTHPNEKVNIKTGGLETPLIFKCECGAKVKATAFEEIPEPIKPIEKECAHSYRQMEYGSAICSHCKKVLNYAQKCWQNDYAY